MTSFIVAALVFILGLALTMVVRLILDAIAWLFDRMAMKSSQALQPPEVTLTYYHSGFKFQTFREGESLR